MSKDLPDSIKSTVRKYLLRVVDDIMDEIEKTYQLGYASGAADEKFDKGLKTRINTTTISDCPIKDDWHYTKGD